MKKKKDKKKESTLRLSIYLFLLTILLVSLIGLLYYLKEKKGRLVLDNKKLLEISQDIGGILKEDLKKVGFTEESLGNVLSVKQIKDGLSWNLDLLKLEIPKGTPLESYEKVIFTSLRKTKGKIFNFFKEEDQEQISLNFEIGVLKYQTHKIILLRSKKLKLKKLPTVGRPKVAIIIDDVGNNSDLPALLKLNKHITLSILPFLLRNEKIDSLHKEGFELMLHLPLEPHGYPSSGKNPGKGAILVDMSEEEIVDQVEKALKNVPFTKGVNNHMGSKATEDERVMTTILKKAKEYNLYFIDSLTSPHSIVKKVAQKEAISFAGRDVFIDNNMELERIKGQVNKLINLAKKKGRAIGIGHAQSKNTLLVLQDIDSWLKKEEVELVSVSKIVK
ncbi:divergent polysaccharide deacetylase family protein [bacterium]|nr:divergent polysaccharide deacetylase family protein [bacterium]MBU1154099.1 divergent polysaccharide deacetylase family protein [bacterium]MBU2599968.1 divergent polysaccharide deacetylase family protein [bacterium]